MSKMYYTEEEAASTLGISAEELAEYVGQQKLRIFQDGAKKMFLAQEIDALAPELAPAEEVELSPADGDMDIISLADATGAPLEPAGKEDTVVTADGISIFDDEDLEIESADPMAKTQIAPSLEDQIALDGVGSGSGLLDLTRESDDTSLGAEVLENIDIDGSIGADIIEDDEDDEPAYTSPAMMPAAVIAPVDTIDASSGFFGGMAVGGAVLALLMVAIAMPSMVGNTPAYVATLKDNLTAIIAVSVLIVIIAGVIGLFIGKSAADRRAAMRMRS
ncbi:MAG TPA: hypothetical protein ENL03_02880 [Phycisphaerae bacterium]|nr:hypothetical protein [Phycisphaerae bacterium]